MIEKKSEIWGMRNEDGEIFKYISPYNEKGICNVRTAVFLTERKKEILLFRKKGEEKWRIPTLSFNERSNTFFCEALPTLIQAMLKVGYNITYDELYNKSERAIRSGLMERAYIAVIPNVEEVFLAANPDMETTTATVQQFYCMYRENQFSQEVQAFQFSTAAMSIISESVGLPWISQLRW